MQSSPSQPTPEELDHVFDGLTYASGNGPAVPENKRALYTAELQDAVKPSAKKTTHNILGFKDAETPQCHGDGLLGDKHFTATGMWDDVRKVFTPANAEQITQIGLKLFSGQVLDVS